ncbi:MAG: hypothetical protein Q4F88_03230 [Eubacteriales bacterium]|nr:hypothetical protein [Eubacteriales bacterium]
MFLAMHPVLKVILIILAIIVVVLLILFLLARKLQPKYEQQQQILKQTAQVMSILVIDKKILSLQESGLPAAVKDNIPVYLKWKKMPIVKARVQGRVMSLVSDDKLFKDIPVKQEIKVSLSGLYITKIISKK